MTPPDPLARTQHRNLVTGADLAGPTVHRESRVDVEDYLEPIAAARTRALHGPGVVTGLRVTATAGSAGLQVAPGVAVDLRGRTVVLQDGGFAVTARDADGTNARNLPTVAVDATGVAVDTGNLTGDRLLTLAWAESEAGGGTLLRHAPWLQLLPAGDPGTAPDAVALAQVTLDATGAVTALSAGLRTTVPTPTGRLLLHAVRDGADPALTVTQDPAAEIRGRADGGLDVALPGTGTPALSVLGGVGTVAVAGALTVGSTTTTRALDVGGPLSVVGPVEIGAGPARLTSGPGGEGGALDVPARARVRQGRDASAGIWLHQNTPDADRAFVGMSDDDHVGFWGNTGAAWALTVDTTSGFVAFKNDFGRPDGPSTLSLFGSRIADVGDFVLSLRSGGGVVAFDGGDDVGIGTRAPRATLEVAGGILARGITVGGDARGDLVVHGAISWDDEHADRNHLRLGRMQLCWGEIALAQRAGETHQRVDFPAPFAAPPVVTASIDDPGFGTSGLQEGAGAWQVDVGGFTALYKSNSGRPGTVVFNWIAIGRWW